MACLLFYKEEGIAMWNPEEQIKSMQPAVARLVSQLEKQKVFFSHIPGDPLVTENNVTFFNDTKRIHISYHSFYRFSGIAVIIRDKKGENNQSEAVPLTDDIYMQQFMKPIIEKLLQEA